MQIVTDSGTDVNLTPEEMEALNITVVPLNVTLDGKTYREGIDIGHKGNIVMPVENFTPPGGYCLRSTGNGPGSLLVFRAVDDLEKEQIAHENEKRKPDEHRNHGQTASQYSESLGRGLTVRQCVSPLRANDRS